MSDKYPTGRVVVRGRSIMDAPLLDTEQAGMMEFYDTEGNLLAFFVRVLSDNTWGLCTRGDEDWDAMCVKYGFAKLQPNVPATDLIRDGVVAYME